MTEYKSFLLRMSLVAAVICAAAYGVSLIKTAGFWRDLATGLLATSLGIIISAMITYGVWLHQRNAETLLRRRRLLRNLKSEVEENILRLNNLEVFLGGDSGANVADIRIQGLRTFVLEYSRTPENLVMLVDPNLAETIDSAAKQCIEFERVLMRGFEQYLNDDSARIESSSAIAARSRLSNEVSAHIHFTRDLLTGLTVLLERPLEPYLQ